jgi:hypothetical protein
MRLVLLAFLCYSLAPAQPARGIFGRVFNHDSHAPVRRAAVKVYNSKDQWDAITDGEGRFQFPEVPPGNYALIAHRDGYTDRAYIVERSDFDVRKELPVELFPQAVIAGNAVDGVGQPLRSVRIEALAPRTAGAPVDVIAAADSDDLGNYRLAGLNPGTYRVRATYREGNSSEFDPAPLTVATANAGPIAVKAGSLTTGIDFVLDPARPATVSGILRTETGPLLDRAFMWIAGQAGEGGSSAQGVNGRFEITRVSNGSYTVSAETQGQADPLFGIANVEVKGADVEGVEIVLRPVQKLAGEIRVAGGAPAGWKADAVRFSATRRIGITTMPSAHPDAQGKFTIPLIPGEYAIYFDPGPYLEIRSMMLDGRPLTKQRLQIGETAATKALVIELGEKRP